LDEVAQTLREHPEIKLVEIQGHTDDRGKRSTNTELSQKRADAVRRYLVGEGIASSRLSAKGFGSLRPRAPNITASGRARNRRVEFHIVETSE
jgi:outer membrane protein OmpA-like peptidoglycan-associated protein